MCSDEWKVKKHQLKWPVFFDFLGRFIIIRSLLNKKHIMKVKNYKDLIVWKKSIELVDQVYTVTKRLPKSEVYGLSSQMQRAAVAISSNIAEGSTRNHRNEFIQFLGIANASAAELETQLIIASRQYKIFEIDQALSTLDEILRMLRSLVKTLKDSCAR